ncbi:hypothetical protein PFBG_03454 [Plasmodium falciparum 7G8]|uniref:Uncharacterized protein n=2 Tax=Plasmodium falciparum TaxID=5833 RepID=A0A024V5P7_PLAFA|nr:hypothetical protein PFFVO_03215 [Plasmodium falciparum Vietnam Oak-Knoll (FVO)]EUR70226.1 hypothetical protein PFBG_03454 [Plasmodium falciparum 7G8]
MREINVNCVGEMKYETNNNKKKDTNEKNIFLFKEREMKDNNHNMYNNDMHNNDMHNNDMHNDDTAIQEIHIVEEKKFLIYPENENSLKFDDNIDDDKSTNYSSIDKSVHIINNSICTIKSNLKYIKSIININEATQSDYTYEDEDINSYKTSSDTSSFVKTYDNINEEDYTSKNSNENNFEFLLNKVINSKKEEKQLDALDIIDECISIGNLYNRKDKKHNEINEENKKNNNINNYEFNTQDTKNGYEKLVPNNDNNIITLNNKMVSDVALNISIEQKNKKNNYITQINNINDDNKNIINSKQLENIPSNNKQKDTTKFSLLKKLSLNKNSVIQLQNVQDDHTPMDEKNKDSRCEGIKTYNRLGIALYKLINLLPNEKRNKLEDYLRIFFKNKERLTILLRERKYLSNFIIYTFFFLSYIFFGFVIIFLKRIVYHIFYDQDL